MLIKGLDYEHIRGTEYNPYNRQYVTVRDYTFRFRNSDVTIPAGYKWDGPTSVPYTGSINKSWLEPSLHHDYLYENQGRVEGVTYTREEVDEFFFENLINAGVSPLYPWIIRTLLDRTFEYVWEDTSEGTTTVLKRYMVPLILLAHLLGAAITTGLVFLIPLLFIALS